MILMHVLWFRGISGQIGVELFSADDSERGGCYLATLTFRKPKVDVVYFPSWIAQNWDGDDMGSLCLKASATFVDVERIAPRAASD